MEDGYLGHSWDQALPSEVPTLSSDLKPGTIVQAEAAEDGFGFKRHSGAQNDGQDLQV